MPLPRPFWEGPRVTPFSRIDLDHNGRSFEDCLQTMDVELEQAVLVIRGVVQGKTVEFQVGSLKTDGPNDGMVLIHRAEYNDLFGGGGLVKRFIGYQEHRILLDCELLPDKNGHAYTIRMDEEQR